MLDVSILIQNNSLISLIRSITVIMYRETHSYRALQTDVLGSLPIKCNNKDRERESPASQELHLVNFEAQSLYIEACETVLMCVPAA